MNCSLKLDINSIVPQSEIEGLKIAAQDAMAVEFYGIVVNNFGEGGGENRPEEWPDLNPLYATLKHGGDRTPTLVLTEDLISSIDQNLGQAEGASVFTDNHYALDHQFGNPETNLPARPFFPVVGNENEAQLTEYAEQKCIAAAQKAIDSRF